MRECIRIGVWLYGFGGCIACLIHMWRNRKERATVRVYAYTLIFELIIVLMYGIGWDIE